MVYATNFFLNYISLSVFALLTLSLYCHVFLSHLLVFMNLYFPQVAELIM